MMIPEHLSLASPGATRGEKKVFAALSDGLSDDFIVYSELPVSRRYADFVVIGRDLGVVVLEVKDWTLQSIKAASPHGFVLIIGGEERSVENPLSQARGYAQRISDLLRGRPALAHHAGPYKGHLTFPYGYGVVFPNMTREELQRPSLFGPSLDQVLGAESVLTKEDLDPATLRKRLSDLCPVSFPWEPLDDDQLAEIRGTLYPEVVIPWGTSSGEILAIMDLEQEQLAKGIGEGHRVVRGVVGSGKTVLLIGRANYLRQLHPEWRILVLCYNRVLADCLGDALDPHGGNGRTEVANFHRWCLRLLGGAGLGHHPGAVEQAGDQFWEEEIPRKVLRVIEEGKIQPGAYEAILVDEAQDFASLWFTAILKMLNPETRSLLIVADNAQKIYRRRFSWREVGIQAAGRTRILRVNYRNTREILDLAYGLVREAHVAYGKGEDEEAVSPERCLRQGPRPVVLGFPSGEAEIRFLAEEIKRFLDSRIAPPEEILVLTPTKEGVRQVQGALTAAQIPNCSLTEREVRERGGVRVSTIHSAKGLEADCVFLCQGNLVERFRSELEGEVKARNLLYIGMTRARRQLCLTFHKESPLMSELCQLRRKIA